MEIDRTEVETDAGTYVIVEHIDEVASIGSPLEECDHEGMQLYVFRRAYNGWEVVYSNLDNSPAGLALAAFIQRHGGTGDGYHDVERRIQKWVDLFAPNIQFVFGWETTRYRNLYYLALVDDSYPHPLDAARAAVREYREWADGEVFGYVVESPAGEHVDSCWGFIGVESREYMVEQARESVHHDMDLRLQAANRVGAGFVGII